MADPKNGDDSVEDIFTKMKNMNNKLLAIDYAKEFVSDYKCPPIHRYFFCKQINQAQQFFTFCCLSSYLINKLNAGQSNLKVDSFDDPNLTIDKILKASQAHVDVSKLVPEKYKLKQGFGTEVIYLLSSLMNKLWLQLHQGEDTLPSKIDIVLRSSDGSQLNSNEDDEDDDIDHDQDNEIELEEEFEDYLESESDLIVQDDWQEDSMYSQSSAGTDRRQMIVANTDLTEWKLELERVLPQINARFLNQNHSYKDRIYESEWRIHLQAARRHHSNIESIFVQTDGMLRNMSNEVRASLDKIRSKENFLHQNSSTILAEWINVRERTLQLKESLDDSNRDLEEKSSRLRELSEEDRSTKQSIEEFSLRMTDSSPLAEAKKAREMLKQELTRVNLQIGVAIQTLVRHVSLHSSYIR